MKHTRGHKRSRWRKGWHVSIEGFSPDGALMRLEGRVMAQPRFDDIYTVWITGHGITKVRAGAIKRRIIKAV
jgi:hypothetical protein